MIDSSIKIKSQCTLTIDVEDWFHLIGAGLDYQFSYPIPKVNDWDSFQQRVCESTSWILDLLDQHKTKATFFVLGWVADRHPKLIKKISERGHEIASHGFWHRVLTAQSPVEFRDDVRLADRAIADITGVKPRGFRASSASITNWALDILAEEGYLYDSSYYPATYHDVYGKLTDVDDTKSVEKHHSGLWLVKFSSLKLGNYMLPWSGGGYFRLLPYFIFKNGIYRILSQTGLYNFYIHPWEIDQEAPTPPKLKTWYKMRRILGSRYTRGRLENLLNDFQFTSIENMLLLYLIELKQKNEPCK